MFYQNPDGCCTYCCDCHHSVTVVPVNVADVRKAEEEAHKTAFKTPNGFTCPSKKTMIQANSHPGSQTSKETRYSKEGRAGGGECNHLDMKFYMRLALGVIKWVCYLYIPIQTPEQDKVTICKSPG